MNQDPGMASKGPPWFKMLRAIASLPWSQLSYGVKCLYSRLGCYGEKSGICNPSHKTLATEMGCSDRRIRELLKELRSCGLIDWTRTQKSSHYRVLSPECFRPPHRNNSPVRSGTKVPVRSEGRFHTDRKHRSDKKMSIKRSPSREAALVPGSIGFLIL
jgi:hypothetical protein